MRPTQHDHAGDAPTSASIWNLPNALTILRVLCVPVMAALLWMDDGTDGAARDAAAVVFILAAVTDLLDGAIARRRGLITTFGKIADPLADKALTGVALVSLSLLGDLPWWVTGVILIREIGVTALRFWVIEHDVIPATRGGKAKTVAQIVAIAMYLAAIDWSWWDGARAVAMAVAVILTVVTGFDYTVRAMRLRRASRGDT